MRSFEIVRRHRGRVFNGVSGCLANPADVEEVVDDTFVRASRGLAKFRGESSLVTWLHSCADIAAALGLNVGTVKSRIARARNHLRTEVNAIAPGAALRLPQSF